MVISAIKVRKIEEDKSLFKGVASVVLDNMFAIHNIKIIEGKKGIFLAMPRVKQDVVHPLNQRTRDIFEKLIIPAYSELLVHDWNHLSLSLREAYKNTDFYKLSYEFYEVENAMIYIPEKFELVEV